MAAQGAPEPLRRPPRSLSEAIEAIFPSGERESVKTSDDAAFIGYVLSAKVTGGYGLPSTGATGLEPATSGVTGRRSNRLSYAPGRNQYAKAATTVAARC